MSDELKAKLRFGFVEMLFALTAAEIAIQFADLVLKVPRILSSAPAYTHLVLALSLVATSWVGWSKSEALGNIKDVESVFSWEFLVLLLDVLLVILYFIIVKGVDSEKTPDGHITIVPSAENETLWIMVVFAVYLIWDFLTKFVISEQKTVRARLSEFWNRGWVSVVCLLLAIFGWYTLRAVQGPRNVVLADVSLLSLVFLFRALKEKKGWGWGFLLVVAFVAPLIVATV